MTERVVAMESLEARKLLAATVGLEDGVLLIEGDPRRANRIEISAEDDGEQVVVRIGGRRVDAFQRDEIESIEIFGGRGNDTVRINERRGELELPIRIETGSGRDWIRADKTAVAVHAGPGNDTVFGSEGDDTILGSGGNDDLYGGSGDDVIRGGYGHDHLWGDDGDDELFGEQGRDLIRGGYGSDLLDGGDSDDDLIDFAYLGERNYFYGGSGRDRFYASRDDVLEDVRSNDRVFWGTLYLPGGPAHHDDFWPQHPILG